MSKFKESGEIGEPDGYWGNFGKNNIEDIYILADGIKLNDEVPAEIKKRFNTAKNLIVYSWFVSHFLAIATLQSLVSLEYALRWRYCEGDIPSGFKKPFKVLLDFAVEQKWFKDEQFDDYWEHQENVAHFREMIEILEKMKKEGLNELFLDGDTDRYKGFVADPDYSYVRGIPKNIAEIRNSFAHGSAGLAPGLLGVCNRCAELINLLFQDRAV